MKFSAKILAAVLLVLFVVPQAWSQALEPKSERLGKDDGAAIKADCGPCTSEMRDDTIHPTKEMITSQYTRDLGGAIPEAKSGATGAVREGN